MSILQGTVYSEEVEKYLNDNIEAPLSKVLQFLDNTDFDMPRFSLSHEVINATKIFIYALIARDPLMITATSEQSFFRQFLSEQDKHDFAAVNGVVLAQEQGFLDSYFMQSCEAMTA